MSPALQQEIQRYAAHGFIVVHQTETTAQLRKPKQFNFGIFLVLGILLFIIGAILYVAWYAAQSDEIVYLSLAEDGSIQTTGSGAILNTTAPQTSWEAWAYGKSRKQIEAQLERARRQKSAPEYIAFLEQKLAALPVES